MTVIDSKPGGTSRGAEGSQTMTAAIDARAFADFTLDTDSGRLLRGAEEIPLRPKSFAVLEYLADNAGRVVAREELLSAVWGDLVVTDDSLTQCVADVRKALGASAAEIVRTVPRRGYLFCAPVTVAVVSPDAVARDAQSQKDDAPPDVALLKTRVGRNGLWISAGIALLALVAGVWWADWDTTSTDTPAALQAPTNSIAVLRFADMSERQDQAYLADGIADEILHLLAQIPELFVIARTSSFALEGQDIETVAAKLDVAHVLEGSVRRSGDRIRITAQLVDTATSAHRWSKTYEREFDDLLEVQTEIAAEIASALQLTLASDVAPASAPPRDPYAYEQVLRAHFFYNRRAPGDIERARELYEQALQIDAGIARAWVGLAAIYALQRSSLQVGRPAIELGFDVDDPRYPDLVERHRRAVEQALRLAPARPESHARAAVYFTFEGDVAKRIEHLERARTLDPDHPLVLGMMARDRGLGNRLDQAIALRQRAVLRDPLSAVSRYNLAFDLMHANRLEEADAEFRKVLALGRAVSRGEGRVDGPVMGIARVLLLQHRLDEALDWITAWPAGSDRHWGLAMVYHALGRPAEADAALKRLIASAGHYDLLPIAEAQAYRGDFDSALVWLDRVGGHVNCIDLASDHAFFSPFLARMRADPRWQAWRSDAELARQNCFHVPRAGSR